MDSSTSASAGLEKNTFPRATQDTQQLARTWAAEVSTKGEKNAPVTIIEFSDFECPFCGRVVPVIGELLKAYPKQIQFIFKHKPLPLHPHAALAHEAALAAGAQGKFWEMHDLLFANQQRLERDDLVRYAKQLNLDLASFQQALDSGGYKPVIEESLSEAKAFGVTSTPTFFVNGSKLLGAQSLETFEDIVNRELGLSPQASKEINIGRAPVRGSASAPVTIVEFSDFQCPFCAKALPVLQDLLTAYPDKVKWVFKNFPLDFHHDSPLAHEAALAAGEQGKFWEMHDRILSNQRAMKRTDLIQTAKDLGLDLARFLADLDSGRFKGALEADRGEGDRLGVTGTPTFFVNGKELVGALPAAEFTAAVDQALGVASKDAGGSREAARAKKPSSAHDPAVSATKGPDRAPVTLVWFSDLQSPLSPKANEQVRQAISAYPEQVRVIFKNRPLEFHSEAMLAHEAALAAGVQGKFWEMHDLIVANQKALKKEDFLGYATRLGLDRERFEAALDGQVYRPLIERDLAEARRLGVFGVPVFFVNDQRIDGVPTPHQLKEIIQAQLERIQAAVTGP